MKSSIKNIEYTDLSTLGFRMPAEWEEHSATWLSYPHNADTFLSRLFEAQEAFIELVYWIAQGETVHINVNDKRMEEEVHARLVNRGVVENIFLHQFPSNDAWCRDHGAIFVTKTTSDVRKIPKLAAGDVAATEWMFNSWGGKYPYDNDEKIAHCMSAMLRVPSYVSNMVLEGGSIEVNGEGVLLTTEACLLNPNRNPDLSKADVETILTSSFGVSHVLWLRDGIVGDDTDGHIDDIARFVNPQTIVTVVEDDAGDENYAILQENLTRLHSFRNRDNEPFRVITLPMPKPVYYREERLPASYANFYICNAAVLVPIFGCDQDAVALDVLANLFPKKKVVGIDARDIVIGLGAFHCLTQQVPISHKP